MSTVTTSEVTKGLAEFTQLDEVQDFLLDSITELNFLDDGAAQDDLALGRVAGLVLDSLLGDRARPGRVGLDAVGDVAEELAEVAEEGLVLGRGHWGRVGEETRNAERGTGRERGFRGERRAGG